MKFIIEVEARHDSDGRHWVYRLKIQRSATLTLADNINFKNSDNCSIEVWEVAESHSKSETRGQAIKLAKLEIQRFLRRPPGSKNEREW